MDKSDKKKSKQVMRIKINSEGTQNSWSHLTGITEMNIKIEEKPTENKGTAI